ncbi:MAG TPA: chitobiase/beta-hexosaminidase C-terminal domain-containing protein, partial [Arachnia sp.]|nr:chitobiase/beta-hexosaminidase C-terminal domain-containing protein [Arachnia sp.]
YTGQAGVPVVATPEGVVPELPETVAVTTDESTTEDVAVEWEALEPGEFTTKFEKVTVSGTASGEAGTLPVSADVWVVPDNLVYLIDTGRVGANGSAIFDAVSALRGDALRNDAPDRKVTAPEDSWGYIERNPSDSQRVSVTPGNAGDWATSYTGDDNDADEGIVYRMSLDAGTYRVTVAHVPRRTQTHGSWLNVNGQKVDEKTVAVAQVPGEVRPPVFVTHELSLAEPTVISYESQKLQVSGGFNAHLSLIAVERLSTVALERPTISPLGDRLTYAGQVELSLSTDTPDAQIRYTTDGSAPTATHGTIYTAPFTLTETATVKAVSVAGAGASPAASTTYTIVADPGAYTSVPVGQPWYDTDGRLIQAHGGGFLEHDGWYYWVGENKTHHGASFYAVSLYRSQDLLNWEFVNDILTSASATGEDAPRLATGQVKVERPKLLYNEATQKFVLWGHWETADSYSASRLVVATSDTIGGLYTYVDDFRPGEGEVWTQTQTAAIQATVTNGQYPDFAAAEAAYRSAGNTPAGLESRDFTVYQDPDSADAYLISAEAHHNLRIYPLSDDYLTADVDASYPLFAGEAREAAAIIKADGRYYLFTSGQSGWYANQLKYAHTTDLSSPDGWSASINVGNNTTFKSQPTYIMDIPKADGGHSYVYMGDRWTPGTAGLGNSTYVWLPLEIGANPDADVDISYTDGWSLDVETGNVVLPTVDLVSQGKPATSSTGTASAGYTDPMSPGYIDAPAVVANPASAANDGIIETFNRFDNSHYWQPSAPLPAFWQVDLGEPVDLARVDISWRSYNGSETYSTYRLSGSVDGENWDVVADRSGNRVVGFTSDRVAGNYRYLKVDVLSTINDHNGSSATWAAGLVEVQVYAESAEEPPALAFEPSVATRCVAGKVYLAVSAKNLEESPIAVNLSSVAGSKSYPAVQAGQTVSIAFNSRQASVAEGVVEVSASAGEVTTTETVAYEAKSCG